MCACNGAQMFEKKRNMYLQQEPTFCRLLLICTMNVSLLHNIRTYAFENEATEWMAVKIPKSVSNAPEDNICNTRD